MGLVDSSASLLAACAGDAVKLFDVAVDSGDPCSLSYSPSPGSQVNCVKWNHTNLVVASAGDDKKITLCHKNGQSMGSIPPGTDFGDDIEDSIISISFSNKSSRYLCSGGTGHIVKIWDLQRKRCIKWLSGHTDTITGVMYNCKDEHLASISMKGDLILHNLASGARATELKDPNGQVLRVLDYSRLSRHVLLTAGDDGSVHLWDTTGRGPKVSWLKQHSAPTTGVCFSPLNDKTIATVGLDKKLYTFDSNSRRPTSCMMYEAPFSSLAYSDDGNILSAGTNSGRVVFYDVRGKPQPYTVLRAYNSSEAVVSLCWQRAKPVFFNEKNCTVEMALLGGASEESVLMPDPLPSSTVSTISSSTAVPSFRSYTTSLIGSVSTTSNMSTAEETPLKSRLWTGASLSKLQAPRSNYNSLKDDMDVFSPLVDVQPIAPSLGNWWDDNGDVKKDKTTLDKRSVLFPSSTRRFPLPEGISDPHPIADWNAGSALGQSTTAIPEMVPKTEISFSSLASETWAGNALSDKLTNHRQPTSLSCFLPSVSLTAGPTFGMQDSASSNSHSNKNSLINTSIASLNLQNKISFGDCTSAFSESSSDYNPSSALMSSGTNTVVSAANHDFSGKVSALPRRYSTYSERISTGPAFSEINMSVVSSPKSKKTGVESTEELMNNILSRQEATTSRAESLPTGIPPQPTHALTQHTDQQLGASSFSLQLIQRTLEESLGSLQQAIHEDVTNLHVELIRQVHMQEMQISGVLTAVLEKLDELTKEVRASRRDQQR